ncbi:Slob family protein kinase [Tieghemostelium lacteum]|uniref:Slob family protein kinase n=1 Tax=Tieghemostelium lacteum TaxID=361077 RepID=A0A152A2V7_TIELA|nr:Slob family protein kinase [Tieghemostelium lacteum]|eukprot:KYR00578.1 Slob family protein kinase [Tieghemostelium lacteum]
MNTVEYILIATAGGFVVILVIILIVVGIVKRGQQRYDPVPEKGNVFIYQKDNSESIKEDTIMMNARFYLRSTMYSLQDRIPRFGSRVDKIYFSILNNSPQANINGNKRAQLDNERIMSMVTVSKSWPIPLYTEIGRSTLKTIVKSLEVHPFISVPLVVDFIPDKYSAVSIRPFYPKGSLRDFIHQSRPKMAYNDKYATHFSLSEKLISKFGRQILEALIFLKMNNFPYYHLNCANILVDDQSCLISDYENAFLGLKPRISGLLMPFAEKMDLEVLSFGAVLFEMACGYELESAESLDSAIPSHCNPEVRKVLESIFKPWYGVPPTLDDLTKMDFFSSHKFKNLPFSSLTYTSKEREMIDAASKLNQSFLGSKKRSQCKG